jgi:hypothetical protein
MAVTELQQMPVVVIVHVAGGRHDMERGTYPHVRRLVAFLIDGRRIPHTFVVHAKPFAQGRLWRLLGVGGIRWWASVAILPLAGGGERLRGRLEVAAVLQQGVGAKGLIATLRLKRRRV